MSGDAPKNTEAESEARTASNLAAEVEELRRRLQEAEDTIRAIQGGEVDAFVVSQRDGDAVYTLETADRPYRLLIERMQQGAVTLGADGAILYANRAFADLLHTPPDTLVGTSFFRFVAPPNRVDFDALLRDCGQEETALRDDAGRSIPVFVSANRLLHDTSHALCLVVTDLTETKQHQAVVAAEALSRSILEQTVDAVIVCDQAGVIIRVSKAARELCGRDPVSEPFERVFPLSHAKGGVCGEGHEPGPPVSLTPVLGGEAYHGLDVCLQRPDGQEVEFLINAGPLRDAEGTVIGLIATLTDVTERKRAEEQIRHNQRELKALTDNVPDVLTRFDRGFRHVFVNAAVERATGKGPADIIGKTNRELGMAADLCDLWEGAIRSVFETGGPTSLEFSFDGPQGTRHYAGRLVPEFNTSHEVEYVLGVTTDVTAQRQTEWALRESEERLRLATEAAQFGFYDADLTTGLVFWSPEMRAVLGVGPGDPTITAGAVPDVVHPADRERVHEKIRASFDPQGSGTFEDEHRIVRPDGAVRWVLLKGKTVFEGEEDQRRPVRAAGVMLDITERKRAEAQAAEAKEEAERRAAEAEDGRRILQALMEHVPEGITIADAPDVTIRMVSKFGRELVGRPPESLVNIPVEEHPGHWGIYHPDGVTPARPEELPLTRATVRGELVTDEEWTIVRPDGAKVPLLCNAGPIRDPQGGIIGGVIAWRDIRRQKQAEEALRLQSAKVARLVEANVIGVVFADNERIVEANDAFLAMVGYSRADLEAGLIRWREMTPPEHAEADERALDELRRTGTCTPFQKEYFRKDGSRVPVLIGAAAVDPLAPNWACFIQDMTRVKQVEDDLREADRRKNEFLAMLAHELRNPLAAISNAINLLRMKGPDDPDLAWGRDVIERQAGQLTRLIDDLLDVSRITRGKFELKPELLDVRHIVSRAAEAVRPLVEAKRHDLRISLPEFPLPAKADPARLQQVLVNLLTNTAKYMDEGGRIALSAARDQESILIRVRDTGIGIAEHQLPHIFGLFTQVDSSLDRSQGGLGIGLTLVKSLTEMHGGTVSAASEGPGRGSEFTVRLPLFIESSRTPERSAGRGGERPGGPGRTTTCRILVVDDNVDTAKSMARLLSVVGHEVRTAHDGPSALELAREFRPQVSLLDIGLPGMNGYQLAGAFRREEGLREATLIAVSGYGQDSDRIQSHEAGFDHHLIKPVDVEALLRLISPCEEDEVKVSNAL